MVNRIRKPLNITMQDELRDNLQRLADTNQLTISTLLGWLGARAVDNPIAFGLLPEKEKEKEHA